MSTEKIRYFVRKPGRTGRSRHYWQPSKDLRKAGWEPLRLSDDLAQALTEAIARNEQLDQWKLGRAVEPADTDRAEPDPAARGKPMPAPPPPAPAGGSVDELIAAYKASRWYLEKAPGTRDNYAKRLAVISRWAGDAPVASITPKRVQTLYDKLRRRTPAMARAVVVMIRILWKFAIADDRADRNPAAGAGLVGTGGKGKLWPRDAIALFVRVADHMGRHSAGTAVLLNEWLGQRPVDLVAFRRPVLSGQTLRLTTQKTGAGVALPVGDVPHLVARIAEEMDRQKRAGLVGPTLLMSESTRAPYTVQLLRDTVRAVRLAAAPLWHRYRRRVIARGGDKAADAATWPEMTDLQVRYLRHTAVTRHAEAGAELAEIAAITGHSLKQIATIIDTYLVRTERLARNAFAKRVERERTGV